MTGIFAAAVVLLVVLGVVLALALKAARAMFHRLRSGPPPPQSRLESALQALAYACPGYVPIDPPPPPLRLMSDEELCCAWRSSYSLLAVSRSARQLNAAAQARRGCLEELERRHPIGFAAWVAFGATADSDPWPYLKLGPHDLPALDWDELTRHEW